MLPRQDTAEQGWATQITHTSFPMGGSGSTFGAGFVVLGLTVRLRFVLSVAVPAFAVVAAPCAGSAV